MGALPRPDLPAGGQGDLNDALHELHHLAGWPSLRTLARDAGCSHTTVSAAFSSARLPSWGVVELLVEAMHGDVARVHQLWLAASRPDRPARSAGGRIAGRQAALAQVRRHLESGTSLLLVTGEAGMGKTRLVTVATESSDKQVFAAIGACLPLSSNVPLLPVADALQDVYRVDDGQWMKEALADCPPFVTGSLRRLLPQLEPGTMLPEPEDPWSLQRLFGAIESLLTSLAAVRSIAVVFEDLHWADPVTLDLLEHMVARDPGVPVVGTWRLDDPATASDNHHWFTRVRRRPLVGLLELDPLDREETAEQLEILLHRPADPDLLEEIYRRSAGHPLFTEQLAVHQGAERELPRLLADLFKQRLDGLGETAWHISRALGIADRSLTDTQLHAATNLERTALTAGLRELADHRLLSNTGSAKEIRLRHPLVAEAIRRRLVAGEALEVHQRLAAALGAEPDASPAEVAGHWQSAGELEQELTWRIAAARAASSRFAARQAAEEWLRVVQLWPKSGTREPPGLELLDVYCLALEALIEADDRTRAAAVAREALTRVPDAAGERAAEVYGHLARSVGGTDLAQAQALANQAVRIYEALPPSAGLVLALDQMANYLVAQDQLAAARQAVARAAEISADLGDTGLHRRMVVSLAWHEVVSGTPGDAVERAGAAARMAPSVPDPVTELVVAMDYTDILLLTGAPADQVEEAGCRGLEAAADLEIAPNLVSLLRSNVAQALTDAGFVDRSAALLDPVAGEVVTRRRWAEHLERAFLDVVLGDLTSAVRRFASLLALGLERPESRWIAERAVLADLWEDRPQDALDRILEALDNADGGFLSHMGEYYVLAARAAAEMAERANSPTRPHELRRRLDELRARALIDPLGQSSPSRHRSAWARTWHAQSARLEGVDSVELWVLAASEWDKLPRPFDAAYCRWRAAVVALRTDQAGLAAKLLTRAQRDAHQHAPLRGAIAATRAGANRAPREGTT